MKSKIIGATREGNVYALRYESDKLRDVLFDGTFKAVEDVRNCNKYNLLMAIRKVDDV